MTDSSAAAASFATLKQQFDIPGKVTLKPGQGSLPCIHIKTADAAATIYLHGAHVTHYQPVGSSPVLFMSDKSEFAANKPIRGGVPICFPWFGQGPDNNQNPPHGFARLLPWTLASVDEQPDGSIVVLLTLQSSDATRQYWPVEFELSHRVTVGKTLALSLEMWNKGNDDLAFEEALHTYFLVGDIRKTAVTGLEKSGYLSKVEGGRFEPTRSPVAFDKETDRVYDSADATIIDDVKLGRKINVDKTQSRSTVVWNPWIAKAQAMADFGDQEWPGMVCVETANVKNDAVHLPPGGRHVMTATIKAGLR